MITIKKAIAVLTDILDYAKPGDPPEKHYATKLGIEALKRISAWRNDNDEDLLWDLPGETEDNSEEAQEIEPEATYP
ncbi:hypothetical protein ES708_33069 [subsurface metagenome]